VKHLTLSVLLFIASLSVAAPGQDATTPGELRSYATIHSIGVEWDITGDADHDATCKVQYRVKGTNAWKQASPPFRVDFYGWYAETKADRAYNMFAGSVLFLQPDTTYELRLDLSDPDGGVSSKTLTIKTRPVPSLPKGGRTLHVIPGACDGDGSAGNPFKGLSAAQAEAKAGDVFLLHKGNYGNFTFDRSGTPALTLNPSPAAQERGGYIVWKAAGDGEVVFDALEVAGSHIWLEGLTLRRGANPNGLRGRGAADVVVSRNNFTGFHYSIFLSRDCRDWTIADNVIVGDNDPTSGDIGGEGIELNHSDGHVVCYNRISRTADGVSYPNRNCDIFGNDIFDVSDDGLEPDYGYANNRMWGNRITNAHNNALSFQPMYCGPWYFIRNQVIGRGGIFKFRVQDRFLLAHNTFVRWGYADYRMHHILTALSRNNLFISAGGNQPIWLANRSADPRYTLPDVYTTNWMTDVDYDGFDWGDAPEAFRWENKRFVDIASFAQTIGIERHGIRVRKEEIFENWNVPPEFARVAPQILSLKRECNAIDAGAVLPNINEDFSGSAPDLGAHEFGKPLPRYGPRAVNGLR
jgi:hypothetical protein